ncbi:MAG: type VI secretion system baseplate subunit TssF [Immundisolibacterales bacterium]|nr:type VI secretion system baseplate subunit TssF [Immundisolibacterales bacterium]
MMDDALVEAYLAELEALREHGRELASRYPDLAGQLDIGPRRSRDPHVERVVESSAFLAARLRLLIESEACELPLAVLSILAPTLVEPVPSMAVVRFAQGRQRRKVTRGTRLDYCPGGDALACFATTMDADLAPGSVEVERLESAGAMPDGLSLTFHGSDLPDPLVVHVAGAEGASAVVLSALANDLAAVEVRRGGDRTIEGRPRSALRLRGFGADEAALPVRGNAHPAHRLAGELIAFPEKFRFFALEGLAIRSGDEVRLRFARRTDLATPIPPGLFGLNFVPVVNLWGGPATPFEVSDRDVEYPIRPDALRYRSVECHSVESVRLYGGEAKRGEELDRIAGFGHPRGTAVRWGARRNDTPAGAEVLVHFEGLGEEALRGTHPVAAPTVLMSNRDLAAHVPAGAELTPIGGGGDWSARLAGAPSPYLPALSGSRAMETLLGHLRAGLSSDTDPSWIRGYLESFPGASRAGWIEAIEGVRTGAGAIVRQGCVVRAVTGLVRLDRERCRGVSHAVIGRVLREVLESRRGLNERPGVEVRVV